MVLSFSRRKFLRNQRQIDSRNAKSDYSYISKLRSLTNNQRNQLAKALNFIKSLAHSQTVRRSQHFIFQTILVSDYRRLPLTLAQRLFNLVFRDSMGLRNGKIVGFRSVITGSTSQDITSSSLPLLSVNTLPYNQQISNSSSLSFSLTTSNHNNNNNNDSTQLIPAFFYSHLINHPSLDSSQFYPTRLEILLDRPPVSREKQIEYGWNHEDRSMNIFVKHNDPCTFHRHPVAQSTDAVRSKKGFSSGIHVWEIEWNTRQRGTHAVVGVGTFRAPLHCAGYQALVGMNHESWGWDLGRNKLYHRGVSSVYAATQFPLSMSAYSNSSPSSTMTTDPADALNNNGIAYGNKTDDFLSVPDKFLVVLDMDEGTLSYIVDGQYLGVAFQDLKDKGPLYPMVSSVWGHCEITMRYINGLELKPLQLMESCRRTIRKHVGRSNLHQINNLVLPNSLRSYLLYQ